MFADNPKIGFLAHAHKYQAALDKGEVLAPAKSLAQMQQVVFNDYVDATLAFGFILPGGGEHRAVWRARLLASLAEPAAHRAGNAVHPAAGQGLRPCLPSWRSLANTSVRPPI